MAQRLDVVTSISLSERVLFEAGIHGGIFFTKNHAHIAKEDIPAFASAMSEEEAINIQSTGGTVTSDE